MKSHVDWVVKIGGRGLIDEISLNRVAADLRRIRSLGVRVALVHGGGPAINEELARRGITWTFHEGQRVTSDEMMGVIEMVLRGSMNPKVVRACKAVGVDAIGISGVDGGTFLCSRLDERLGRVGQIDRVQTKWVESIARQGAVPVVAPIGIGHDGRAFNINADWAAAKLATALRAKSLVFLTDQDGILDSEGQLIESLNDAALADLIEGGVVTGGMLAKVRTIRHALGEGICDVRVANANRGLATFNGRGTRCSLRLISSDESRMLEVVGQ